MRTSVKKMLAAILVMQMLFSTVPLTVLADGTANGSVITAHVMSDGENFFIFTLDDLKKDYISKKSGSSDGKLFERYNACAEMIAFVVLSAAMSAT